MEGQNPGHVSGMLKHRGVIGDRVTRAHFEMIVSRRMHVAALLRLAVTGG